MSDDREKRLKQLREAYESGLLDEDTYHAAAGALGGQVDYEAAVEGDGAVAQGKGAVAAGAGALLIAGDVLGDVYQGPPTTEPSEALRIYRRVLFSSCCRLPLRGVDLEASDPTAVRQRFSLADVYVDLDTKTQARSEKEDEKAESQLPDWLREMVETHTLGLLEAAADNPRLVILGDPGSGKSTFLKYLGLSLAGPKGDLKRRLPNWPVEEMGSVPILLTLRDFARWLSEGVEAAKPRHLWDFICSRLNTQNLDFAAEPLRQALEVGEAVALLDGLDEIPTKEQRTFVRDAVAAFAGRYPRSRVIVTCRVLSYQDPAWQLAGFPEVELAPFDEEKVDHFIGAWYQELVRLKAIRPEDADGLADKLRGAVRRPELWLLASNPLLLTVMSLVHTHKGRLPDARALLYEDTVDILLWRWEQVKAGTEQEAPRLRQLLLDAGRTDVDLKRVLWRLAFEAHRQGGFGDEGLADIGELRLEKALARLHPNLSRDWAQQVIETMKLRAGLLLEREPEVYSFPHRTFQEYLAGAYLSAQADFSRQAATLVEDGAFWREVILLAVGRLVYLSGDTDKPLALVGELCPRGASDGETAWRKAWLAGDVLAELGLNRVREGNLGRDLLERVRGRLGDLLVGGYLEPVERAAAGRALARLGDPRRGVGLRDDGLPDIEWCEVPPGPFLMGSSDEDEMAIDREKPQHTYEIEQPYAIGRYPVTNAQYAAFVQAGGYGERRYWTEAGWSWRESNNVTEPEGYGEPFSLSNHPVVGVSWYEAAAFCRWLTEQLRGRGELVPDEEITLPTEPQWEKAAAAEPLLGSSSRRSELLAHKRIYPWGNESDPEKANYADTGIGATSAVGCFPGGASPFGVEDLSGNVWEWTRSLWGEDLPEPDFGYPYNSEDGRENLEVSDEVCRVVRGGAFSFPENFVRCASRDYRNPYYRFRYYGFRVVVSPYL